MYVKARVLSLLAALLMPYVVFAKREITSYFSAMVTKLSMKCWWFVSVPKPAAFVKSPFMNVCSHGMLWACSSCAALTAAANAKRTGLMPPMVMPYSAPFESLKVSCEHPRRVWTTVAEPGGVPCDLGWPEHIMRFSDSVSTCPICHMMICTGCSF